MTSPTFVLVLTCLVLGVIAQGADLKSASSVDHERRQTGENLTLTCDHGDTTWVYWFKQTLGEELKPVYVRYFKSYDSLDSDLQKDSRLTLDALDGKTLLTISDLLPSDSATYHCISFEAGNVKIQATVTVSVEGSGLTVPALVHQSESEAIQHEGSVTLSCTVHTGGCDGEHSVYWFKDSEESHPGLIYTHGGRNHQCERRNSTETNTCVYNLPLRSLNVSHAGTYYCAVVSCGHILFGNGNRLDFGVQRVDQKLASSVHHERRQTGENLTLTCDHGDTRWVFWFKQTLGEELKLVSARYFNIFHSLYNEFKNNSHFSLDAQNGKTLLTISDLQPSDSATYHCINFEGSVVQILATVTVSVEGYGSTVPALVHQSESEAVRHGGSVTLSCTVHTGGCDGEHSVYWFKDSEESHPGLIYTHGGSNRECERRNSTETNTCVYNLPLRSLNVSHAGTYYCAVVSCGHILFGNGTRLDFGG